MKKWMMPLVLSAGLWLTGSCCAAEVISGTSDAQPQIPASVAAQIPATLTTEQKEALNKATMAVETEYNYDAAQHTFTVKWPYRVSLNNGTNNLEVAFTKTYTFAKANYKNAKYQPACSYEIKLAGTKKYVMANYLTFKVLDEKHFALEMKTPKERKAIYLDKKDPLHGLSRAKSVNVFGELKNWQEPETAGAEEAVTYFSEFHLDLDKYAKIKDDLANALKNNDKVKLQVVFWNGGSNEIIWLYGPRLEQIKAVLDYDLYQDSARLSQIPEAQKAM